MSKIIKSRIFIENGTDLSFDLKDIDGNIFSNILARQKYSVLLNVNSNTEKRYDLFSGTTVASFWINTNGEIGRVQQPSSIILDIVKDPNKNLSIQDSDNVEIFLKSRVNLIIAPSAQPSSRSTPIYFINPIDEVFRLDFTDRS